MENGHGDDACSAVCAIQGQLELVVASNGSFPDTPPTKAESTGFCTVTDGNDIEYANHVPLTLEEFGREFVKRRQAARSCLNQEMTGFFVGAGLE